MGIESLERELGLELSWRFNQIFFLNSLSGMGTLSFFSKVEIKARGSLEK
jgi:hypothetical protein